MWLEIRETDSERLFYGHGGRELSYVAAWFIMRKAIEKAGLEHKGYSLHSLRMLKIDRNIHGEM